MAPLVHSSDLASVTISRTGETKRMFPEMNERCGDEVEA